MIPHFEASGPFSRLQELFLSTEVATEPVTTPDPAALPSHASDALWTSDSQRADSASTIELDEDEPAAPVTEAPAELQTQAERDEAGKFKTKGSGKPRNDPQARVQQATAKEAAAKEEARKHQERADRLERELAETRQRPTQPERQPERAAAPESKPSNGQPAWSSFEDQIGTTYKSWGDATDAYNGAWFYWQDEQREWKSALSEVEQAAKNDAEFAKSIADLPCSTVMGHALRDSKHRLDIMRYLGSHPEECIQLAHESDRLTRDAAPMVRRHLESLIARAAAVPDSAPVVRPSTAAPPVNRVGGTVSATPVDPEDLEFGPEFIRRGNAEDKRRQQASRW